MTPVDIPRHGRATPHFPRAALAKPLEGPWPQGKLVMYTATVCSNGLPMPYHSNYGPRDGPIMFCDAPVMGVFDEQGQVIGIAWLAGSVSSKRGPVQVWRLEVGKVELDGPWICRHRVFLRLGDAAESV